MAQDEPVAPDPRVVALERENGELRARVAALEAEAAELRAGARRAREHERFLESVVENIPDMIFVKDADELRFVRFNAAGEALLGHRREALIGKNDHDFFPTEEARFFIESDREVLRRGVLVDIPEEPIHTVHGERWLHTKKIPILDEHGHPLYLLGISEDITARKAAVEALEARTAELARTNEALVAARDHLRASEARLRVLLARLPGAVWTADAGLRLTSAGGARAGALGLDGEARLGEPIEDVLTFAGPEVDVVTMHREALAGAPRTWEAHVDGHTYEVVVERVGDRAADGVVAVALDVTERRRIEAERLRARLERGQKLEMLGLLAGGIAHDFNNLLAAILGNASLALLKLPPDTPARKVIERVEASASAAADLTRQLLAYSGKGRFVVEPVDVSGVLGEVATLLRVSIPRKVALRLDLAEQLPRTAVDVAQLRQVVMNLLTNAADAVGDSHGTITLSTGVIDADRGYLSHAWLDEDLPEGRYVWLEVSDTGVGMDPDVQNQMFDPFYTTKPKGHGLGLSATLGIVRSHRGAIRVYSEPGRGTSVKVLLPALPADDRPAAPPPAATAAVATGTVLVVDDDEAVREFASDTLQTAGFTVLTAVDGLDAVERYRSEGAHIDAVLLDMTMPRLSGEETFRELRRLRPEVRVLLSSGYNEQEATSRFAGKGLAGFIQKPYRAKDLIDRLRLLVGGGS